MHLHHTFSTRALTNPRALEDPRGEAAVLILAYPSAPFSRCRCCLYCGWGPCAQVPKFKKVSDTEYEGSGESQLGETGLCTPCCHNKGDKIVIRDGGMVWTAGTSPAYPPCFQNKEVVKMKLAGGAPASNEMER